MTENGNPQVNSPIDPDQLRRIGEGIKKLLPLIFLNYNPMPDKDYARKVGWPVNEDGTIDTPGMGRVPSRELCEEKQLEKLYEVSDLIHLHKLEDNRG
jgi:hypothetical protein